MNFKPTLELIEQGIKEDVFPCAAFAIGNKAQVLTKGFTGNRALYPKKEELHEDTLFDMASLSKLISTTMVALKAIELGKLCLDDNFKRFFDDCHGKEDGTVLQLLTHTSGIASHIPLWELGIKKEQACDAILSADYAYAPQQESVYSCMGFILLQNILQKVFDLPLDILAKKYVFEPLEMETACYNPLTDNVASTEFAKDINGYASGIVHDENARFLGGVSGNAGVFCSLDDMIKFCDMLANKGKGCISKRTFEQAIQNRTQGMAENRGLGFLLSGDKPSFAGDLFSSGSYGHTGFTGTSVMVDKSSGMYALLLTNRVHFGRENNKIIRFRRQFHNSLWASQLEMDK